MKQKSLSNWLKIAVIMLGIFGLIIYGVVLPSYGLSLVGENPELAHYFWPWMTLFLLTAVPCYIALFFGWNIAHDIGLDRSFSEINAKRMKWISNLAFGDVILFFFGNVMLLFLNMNHPGVFLLSLLPDVLGIAISVCAAALSHLIFKSAQLQEDTELTI